MSKEKEKAFSLNFITVEDRSLEIVRLLAKCEIEKVLSKHGATVYNLDDVVCKYITGEMRNEHEGEKG